MCNVVFEAATAFANVRRLQILRWLVDGGEAQVDALTEKLRMSESAATRHMAKLSRRGYVRASRVGRELVYRLAPRSKTPIHTTLFRIVRSEWGKRESQS